MQGRRGEGERGQSPHYHRPGRNVSADQDRRLRPRLSRTVPAPARARSPTGSTTRPIGRPPVEHHVPHRLLPRDLHHGTLRPFCPILNHSTVRPRTTEMPIGRRRLLGRPRPRQPFRLPRVRGSVRHADPHAPEPVNDRELIGRVLAGDPGAERALYDAHVDRVFRLVYRMAGDPDRAQDCVQETSSGPSTAWASSGASPRCPPGSAPSRSRSRSNGLRQLRRAREREVRLDEAGPYRVTTRSRPTRTSGPASLTRSTPSRRDTGRCS